MVPDKLKIRDKTIFDGFFTKTILKSVFTAWFKIAGWKVTRSSPQGTGVAIAAPHTSNWDFIYALGAAIIQDVKIYFSIKDSWCKLPVIGRFMMWLGAMPIDRTSRGKGQVDLIKDFVTAQRSSSVFFLFTPEGTRSKSNKGKTGFYHVAKDCELPIFLAKVDYLLKEAGVFHSYSVTNDKEHDIKSMQASYKCVAGKHLKQQFPCYEGAMPKLSELDAVIIKTLYSLKGVATRVDIAAKIKKQEISQAMLDFLVEKNILEKQVSSNSTDSKDNLYKLTFIGRGCLLHLYPTLAH